MASSPDQVRTGLTIVTGAAVADTRSVVATGGTPDEIRAALFVAIPLIVHEYSDGAAALALDWYDELRTAADPKRAFVPAPPAQIADDYIKMIVATSTSALRDVTGESLPKATEVSLTLLQGGVQELVAGSFRTTMTENSLNDPAAAGWRRFARPGACKFCLMLADRGAVYTERTARFAAHAATTNGKRTGGDCMCIAGPAFGGKDVWAEATPLQYVASRRTRTPEQRAKLREYLTQNFPDAPG